MTDEHVEQFLEQQKIIIEKLSQSKVKDKWDKLAILSTFLSSIVIGVVGIYFTATFKDREITTAKAQVEIAKDNADAQVRVSEAQVAQQFIPNLAGQNENAKKGAVLILSTLRNKELAFKLGAFYASQGTIEALELLLKTYGEGEDKTLLKDALVDALLTRAQTNYEKDWNYDQILSDCKRILELKSQDELRTKNNGSFLAYYYQWRAFAHCVLKHYDLADSDFAESLKIAPKDDLVHSIIGDCYSLRGNKDEALKQYNLAIDTNKNPIAHFYRGRFFSWNDKPDQAIPDFNKYVSAYPNDYKGRFELAKAYEKKQQQIEYCANLEIAQNLVHRQTGSTVDERDVGDIDNRMTACPSNRRTVGTLPPASP